MTHIEICGKKLTSRLYDNRKEQIYNQPHSVYLKMLMIIFHLTDQTFDIENT